MPIDFTCPHCGTKTNVADEYAGQTGPCQHCGQQVTITGTPVGSGAYAAAPQAQKKSAAGIIIAVVVGVVLMFVVCGGILAALMFPAVGAAREAARRAQCCNNMKQIELALHNYHDAHGEFPPAYVADEDGKPMYSWRVLILPYLEENSLYEQYNLDEPWDSPANQAVTRQPIGIFQCPSARDNDGTKTNYVMVVGPGCLAEGAKSHSLSNITDGASSTIMVVEVADSDIGWAEPRDLDAATMSFDVNAPPTTDSISSHHPGGANVGMADGSVHFLAEGTDPDLVRGMTQVADGQPGGSFIP